MQALQLLASQRDAAPLVAPSVSQQLLDVLRDMARDLPRSLWPELRTSLDEWRTFVDPAPGSAAEAAVRSVPVLFDPVRDTWAGERIHEYVQTAPAVRDREGRQREQAAAEAAAAVAARDEAVGAEGVAAATPAASDSASAESAAAAGTGGPAALAMAVEGGAEGPPLPTSTASPWSGPPASAPALGAAPSPSADPSHWRYVTDATLTADGDARRRAVQRRDVALSLLSVLASLPGVPSASRVGGGGGCGSIDSSSESLRSIAARMAGTPGLLPRLVAGVCCTLGYRGAPGLAATALRALVVKDGAATAAGGGEVAAFLEPHLPALRAAAARNPSTVGPVWADTERALARQRRRVQK